MYRIYVIILLHKFLTWQCLLHLNNTKVHYQIRNLCNIAITQIRYIQQRVGTVEENIPAKLYQLMAIRIVLPDNQSYNKICSRDANCLAERCMTSVLIQTQC
jgi:hypothetical protein